MTSKVGGVASTKHDDQPLVSIFTPVYNGERYLSECMESVLAQSYQTWEYVIVNNCSTDTSLEIAQKYAQRDSRIRVHNNERFVSVIENHLVAFRQISVQSKYCKVVHADDLLFPECLMAMVRVAEANPSVGIVGAYRLDDRWVNLDGLPYPSTVVPGREICRLSLLKSIYPFGSPTSLLFRSDVIRNGEAFYDESNFSVHADLAACYRVLQNSDFGFVHQVLTYTRRHEGAQTSFSKRVNTYIGNNINLLKRYGPFYLDHPEYEERLKQAMKSYFKFLGLSTFQLRDQEFWEFHRESLRTLGYANSRAKLLQASAVAAADLLLAPVRRVGRGIRFLKKRLL